MSTISINGQAISMSKSNLLGKGHFGAVYAVSDIQVIKIFTECASVEEEFASQLAAYECELAPKPISCGWTDCFAYQYILMDRVHAVKAEAFTLEELMQFAYAVADKLKAFHNLGYAHRDIQRPVRKGNTLIKGGKWDNILLTKAGITLLDYGQSTFDHPEMKDDQTVDLIDLNNWIAEMQSTKGKQLVSQGA